MMETSYLTKNRIYQLLKEGKRFDGRALDAYREIVIETGVVKKAEGSARVKIGNTEVIVGVKMDVAKPFADSSDQGILVTSAELLPLSSPRYEPGPPRFEAISYGRLVDRGLRESKFIDFKKLCISEGEKVWMIFVDLYPLNDDGNLMDAFSMGALAALQNARIPVYDEKAERVQYGEWTDKHIPLTDTIPLMFNVHKIGERFFIDPTKEEEDTSEANFTLAISKGPMIHALQKNGAEGLSAEEFAAMLTFSEQLWKKMYPKIIKETEHKKK